MRVEWPTGSHRYGSLTNILGQLFSKPSVSIGALMAKKSNTVRFIIKLTLIFAILWMGSFLRCYENVFATEKVEQTSPYLPDTLKEQFVNISKKVCSSNYGYEIEEVNVIDSVEIAKPYYVIYGSVSSEDFNGIVFWAPIDSYCVIYDNPEDMENFKRFSKMILSEKVNHIRQDFKDAIGYEFPTEEQIEKYSTQIQETSELYKKFILKTDKKLYDEALPIAKLILKMNEKIYGAMHLKTSKALFNLGQIYVILLDYPNAIPLFERSLFIDEKVLGSDHPQLIYALNNLGDLYRQMGQYDKALEFSKRSLVIIEKTSMADNQIVADALNTLASIYYSIGEYDKAEPLFKRSLSIYEQLYGSDHPRVSPVLINLSVLYREINEYAQAESLLERALAINEKKYGPNHLKVANTLNILAGLNGALGKYSKAKLLYLRTLAIYERVYDPDHPEIAYLLNSMAKFYILFGAFSKAKPLLERALTINEKVYGPDHPEIAINLNNMAELYCSLGDYAKAESLYKKALTINEKIYGSDHSSVAAILNNIGNFYIQLGDYAQAEPLLKRGLSINEKVYGPDHLYVALNLSTLGLLYNELGDYTNCEHMFKRALTIKEKTLGPDHPDTALGLYYLASTYCELGDYVKAELLFKRSMVIDENTYGPDHPRVAFNLSNLALLYVKLSEHAKAEPLMVERFLSSAEFLFERALSIDEKAYGPDHPNVALILTNLATTYGRSGKYAKTESLLERALSIDEKAYGPDHPNVAEILTSLAMYFAGTYRYKEAYAYFKKAQEIDENVIESIMGFTSEEQKLKFLSLKREGLYLFINLVNQRITKTEDEKKEILDIWFKRKGIVLETQRRFQEALIESKNIEALKIYNNTAQYRSELSKLIFSGPGKQSIEKYRQRMDEINKTIRDLEVKLSRISQNFALKQKVLRADTEQVLNALPNNSVLIEFARIKTTNFKLQKMKQWGEYIYLAFVLHAGNAEHFGWVDLGSADKIDSAIAELKKNILHANGLRIEDTSKKLYKMIFEPIKNEIGTTKKIFISPDGQLNLLPFEVLQNSEGKFLIEDYTFNYLAVGRDVVGFGNIKNNAQRSLIIGNPDFDLTQKTKQFIMKSLTLDSQINKGKNRRSTELKQFNNWKPLKSTGEEVLLIHDLIGEEKSDLYTGKQALEEVLMTWGTPEILHLATHGFFIKDSELSVKDSNTINRGVILPFSNNTQLMSLKNKKIFLESPLLRSGIVLAGANRNLESDDSSQPDGIVTAEKILGLNLKGTTLVVLSACDTGLGEVKTGEGVFGLRRAFVRAGAKSLVMSMWKVPDIETKELMVQFYENFLSGKMNKCQALRQAALKEMAIVKDRYGKANPLYWGGFVFLGNPN